MQSFGDRGECRTRLDFRIRMMGSDTISTQNLCTLVVRCLQTHPESAHGLTLQLLVEDVWKTFEESTLPNPFTKQVRRPFASESTFIQCHVL